MAARHLWHFGFRPKCLYPKPTQRQLFTNLVEQCKQLDIEFLPSWPAAEDLGEKGVRWRVSRMCADGTIAKASNIFDGWEEGVVSESSKGAQGRRTYV